MRLALLFILVLSSISFAGFEKWTSADGREAEMNLIGKRNKEGQTIGKFSLRSGRTVELSADQLASDDAERLKNWKPPGAAFDDFLDGKLLQMHRGQLGDYRGTKPEKFYIFYYSASWCPPCQRYTPSLVKWYEDNKNDNFELIFISSDRDKSSMTNYVKSKKMPWAVLQHARAHDFKREFSHKVTGIPSVITCDLEGNIVSRTESLTELSKLVE